MSDNDNDNSVKDGIKKLNRIKRKYSRGRYGPDNESIHIEADDVLLEFMPPKIRDRYVKLREDIDFWYA